MIQEAEIEGPAPLQIRLNRDISTLPAGIAIQLPRDAALMLILHGAALPVGDMTLAPDLILDEDAIEGAGIEFDLIAA